MGLDESAQQPDRCLVLPLRVRQAGVLQEPGLCLKRGAWTGGHARGRRTAADEESEGKYRK